MNVLEVAPEAGTNVPAPALKVPPVPEVRVQTPPASSPEIKLYKSIDATLESQTVVLPFVPAPGCAFIVTVAMLESLIQGAVPVRV